MVPGGLVSDSASRFLAAITSISPPHSSSASSSYDLNSTARLCSHIKVVDGEPGDREGEGFATTKRREVEGIHIVYTTISYVLYM